MERREYTFNQIDNCGPLNDLPGNPIRNFAGGRYDAITLKKDTIVYNAGPAGGLRLDDRTELWCTRSPAPSAIRARVEQAIPVNWQADKSSGRRVPFYTGQSTLEATYELRLAKGTVIYEGPAATVHGIFLGGGKQIYVPVSPNHPNVTILREMPIGHNEPVLHADRSARQSAARSAKPDRNPEQQSWKQHWADKERARESQQGRQRDRDR